MMRDANIVTLYKNKGARRACNNYQGISLLSIVIKLFARVVLKGSKCSQGDFILSHRVVSLPNDQHYIRSNSLSSPAINSVSLAKASLQWPQALPSVTPSFWEPLSS